ncbi:hypothetical protein [Burkholderia pyrrocinia]|uniref:hypothetical protein n=1 Tax=Burkholderia pyrrocinia TaxID=60550 RepID=UPI00104FEDD0|nr:hypothetical protein [Burkholderia pyrrocinia]
MGIASSLMRSIIDTMPVTEHDLAFAIARNDIALRVLRGHVDTVVVGRDGSPNIVHGVHEHHVVAIEKFRSPRFKHCLPDPESKLVPVGSGDFRLAEFLYF